MTEHSADRQLRERARAVIPGGMYGHQSAPGAEIGRASCRERVYACV